MLPLERAQARHLLPALQALLCWARAQGLAPSGPDSGLHPSGLLLWALSMSGAWSPDAAPAPAGLQYSSSLSAVQAVAAAREGQEAAQKLLSTCAADPSASGEALVQWLTTISDLAADSSAQAQGFRLADPVQPGRWCVDLRGGEDGGQVLQLAQAAGRALQLLAVSGGSVPALLRSTGCRFSLQVARGHGADVLAREGPERAAATLQALLASTCGAEAAKVS